MSCKIEPLSEMDHDDTDTYYSFMQSTVNSFSCSDISNIEFNDTSTKKNDMKNVDIQKVSSKAKTTQLINYQGTSKKKSILDTTISQYKAKKTEAARCYYTGVDLDANIKVPDDETFDMSGPLKISRNKEAKQKLIFTKIWIEEQQGKPKRKSKLHREFAAKLEAYFRDESSKDLFKKLTLKEKDKRELNNQLFMQPDNSNNETLNVQTTPETNQEPYISPFADMPTVPKETCDKRPGITVPAGFDLTQIVKYKNADHWHRRATTRYDKGV